MGNSFKKAHGMSSGHGKGGKELGFKDKYTLGKELGSGAFSVVRLATSKMAIEVTTVHAVRCLFVASHRRSPAPLTRRHTPRRARRHASLRSKSSRRPASARYDIGGILWKSQRRVRSSGVWSGGSYALALVNEWRMQPCPGPGARPTPSAAAVQMGGIRALPFPIFPWPTS